uniref:Uncharacterized protein LOC116298839 n=1 Tax=Actinia tenebrosa TaxID=6105 RepID=A0A6P8I5P9_ACTTE
MECVQLADRPLCCQFLSMARSMKIHAHSVIDDGTLLREENGAITATGKENDQYTVFKIYKYTVDDKLAYKIQSIEDKVFLAIDKETENLITTKDSENESTLFWPRKIYDFTVLQSVVGMKCYLYVDASGAVITTKIHDEEDLRKDVNVWFKVHRVAEG